MKELFFRDPKDIKRLKEHLKNRPREYALFIIGINTPWHLRNILELTVADVKDKKIRSVVKVVDPVDGRKCTFVLNRRMFDAIQRLLSEHSFNKNDYLFTAQKYFHTLNGDADKRKLRYKSALKLIKKWATETGIPGYFAGSTLRKTYAYHKIRSKRRSKVIDLEGITAEMGQRTIKMTFQYLGLPHAMIEGVSNSLENDSLEFDLQLLETYVTLSRATALR